MHGSIKYVETENQSMDCPTLRCFSFVQASFFVVLQLRQGKSKAYYAKGTSRIWFPLMTRHTADFT
jgi:hypothetical protein